MLRLLKNRRVLAGAALIAGLLTVALWPATLSIESARVVTGPLTVTIDDEGMTRVCNRFVVSAPLTGRVLRIELEPGDTVMRGQVVAQVRAEAPPLLDARTRAEALAAVDSARAAVGRARAEEQRARATLAQSQRDLARMRELAESRVVSKQELEAREAEAAVSTESLNAATFAVRAANSELQRTEARLTPSTTDVAGRVVTVRSPVDGVVLKRVRESESVVPAGEPLLEIGNPQQLEIVADFLSSDAVRIKPGARAIIEQWGGDKTLDARVRRIEPAGFTKISALGVEEQRVNVVLDFTDPTTAWAALGDAYRVEVRVVIWESPHVVQVATSALFREGDRWATYVVAEGRARRTLVDIGHQTGQDAEVTSGLADGTRVILHPGDTLKNGVRVAEKSTP